MEKSEIKEMGGKMILLTEVGKSSRCVGSWFSKDERLQENLKIKLVTGMMSLDALGKMCKLGL